jgi:predicted dehydrogenase
MEKRRYVQVGIGGRSFMYSDAIVYKYAESCELVGLCDVNQGRMDLRNKWFTEGTQKRPKAPAVKTYPATDFDRMIAEQRPNVAIVTTKDCHHDEYIVRAMELGCDAITEKPMTINAEKCQRIIDTMKRTGRKLAVTFNYRYSPVRSKVKEVLMAGTIGKILSVDFFWNLNTSHGADYFRRWHRNKANSGGLLVHKATHHFDLVNWWLGAVPGEVFCLGSRQFYTPQQAESYGLKNRAKRCHGCPEAAKCKFYLNMDKGSLRELYLDQEKYDGYIRDKCVFSDEIDIEDSMNAVVRYHTGAMMSYALNAFTPWEGYAISFNGTKGRLEHTCVESIYVSGDGSVPGEMLKKGTSIVVHPHLAPQYVVQIPEAKGGHGGGDEPLLEAILSPHPPADPLQRTASVGDGAYSILTGIAANESIRTGKTIRIADLVTGIPRPSYQG